MTDQVQEIKDLQVDFLRKVLGENLVKVYHAPAEAADYIARNMRISHEVPYYKVTPLDLELISRAVGAELVQKSQAVMLLAAMKATPDEVDGIDVSVIWTPEGKLDNVALAKLVLGEIELHLDEGAFEAVNEVRNNPEAKATIEAIVATNPAMYEDDSMVQLFNSFVEKIEERIAAL
jgi:hypothetical protein